MEVLDFEVEKEPEWVVIKLSDGAVLKFKVEIVAVFHSGNDPNTGLPVYGVQLAPIVRLVSLPTKRAQQKDSQHYA